MTMEHALHPLLPRDKVPGAGSQVLRFFRLEKPGALMRRAYFWTALSGGCFCASSLVLLVLVVRLLGEHGPYWGGVFSIALAVSQQLITIGLFQMRPFQVSDVDETFSFSDCLTSRALTVGLMAAAGAAWIVAGGAGTSHVSRTRHPPGEAHTPESQSANTGWRVAGYGIRLRLGLRLRIDTAQDKAFRQAQGKLP